MQRKEIEEKLKAYLVRNRLKSTSQRDAIIEAFLSLSGKHVTIEELLNVVRRKNSNIGYATVYRTLILLVDAGIASQRHFQEGPSQFELVSDHHHDHLICTHCGKIFEFENESIEKLQNKVAAQFKFELTGHRMELFGICEGMRKRGVCSHDSGHRDAGQKSGTRNTGHGTRKKDN